MGTNRKKRIVARLRNAGWNDLADELNQICAGRRKTRPPPEESLRTSLELYLRKGASLKNWVSDNPGHWMDLLNKTKGSFQATTKLLAENVFEYIADDVQGDKRYFDSYVNIVYMSFLGSSAGEKILLDVVQKELKDLKDLILSMFREYLDSGDGSIDADDLRKTISGVEKW